MRTDTFSFCRSALPDPTIQNRNRFALSAFRARPLSGVPNVKTRSTFGDQEKLGELFRKINVKTRIQKCKIRRRLTWGKQYQYMSVVTVWYAHGAKNRKIAKYIKYLKPPKGDKVVRWFAGLWFWVLLLCRFSLFAWWPEFSQTDRFYGTSAKFVSFSADSALVARTPPPN